MMENVEEILPLSPVQSGMLFEAISGQAAPGTYVAAVTISLEGTLDLERFQTALNNAIRVRDALRASFIWEGVSQPVQLIAKTIALPITMLDWSDNKSRFIWTAHHLIADGWSTGVLTRDIVAHYNGTQEKTLNDTNASYRSYLSWLKKRDTKPDLAFWSDYLEGIEGPTSIAFKPDQKPPQNAPFQRITIDLPSDLINRVQTSARVHRITTVTLLSTVWALTLRRYSGQSDVTFGQTNAGRPAEIKGINNAVGTFVNTLPVRMKISPDQTAAGVRNAICV